MGWGGLVKTATGTIKRLMLLLSFFLSLQKKQRFERKSTQEVTISSPRSVCEGKPLYFPFCCKTKNLNVVFECLFVLFSRLQTPTVSLERFLEAMGRAVDQQREEQNNLINSV